MTATGLGRRMFEAFHDSLHFHLTGTHPTPDAPVRDWDDWHYAEARAPWEDE